MIVNYKYAIYPSDEQVEKLLTWISYCRHTYNSALLDKNRAYKKESRSIGVKELQTMQTADKKNHIFLSEMPSQPLQEVFQRLKKSFEKFFRKEANYPKLKKHKDYNSITFPQFGFSEKINPKTGNINRSRLAVSFSESGFLQISKLGVVQVDWHRPLEGTIKQVIIKKQGFRWYAIFSVERQATNENIDMNNAVGIDVGIETFSFLSNGEKVGNPKYLRKSERKLKRVQQKLSKMKRGSTNYKKRVQKLQKVHEKVANQRKDFLHKTSYHLSKTYSVICVENLNIRNMVRNRKLSKSIHDAGWGMFRNFLNYKCYREGGRLIKVEPKYTTQDCSECGNRVKKSLSVRTHVCLKCGTVLDRDHNSALNILHKGLQTI